MWRGPTAVRTELGADDRPQRRLAGQRRRQLGLGGEERADVVGVAGDGDRVRGGAVHAEDLAELAAGAEDELDLALVEAQRLEQARQRDLRRGWRAGPARPARSARRGRAAPRRRARRRGVHPARWRSSRRRGYRAPASLYSQPMQANPRAASGVHVERRTKIIATVGPASWEPATLEQLIEAGADVFRLNFSHAGPDRQARDDRRHPRRRRAGRARGRGARRPARAEAADRRAARRLRRAEDGHARDPDPARASRATARRSRSPGRGSPTCERTSSSTSPTARSGCGSTTPSPRASTARSRWAGPSPRTRG